MSQKAQPLSTRVNSDAAPTSATNSVLATDVLLTNGPAFKLAGRQRKRTGARRHDLRTEEANGFAKLTQRETDVMRLLAHGLLYKEIADQLGMSYSAVQKHQHNIFKKFGLNNRSEATRKWLEVHGH